MDSAEVPRTPDEIAALEARYRPIDPAAEWSGVACDAARWQRHADALRASVQQADPEEWNRVRAGFLRAAALDSSALAQLTRPAPDLTTIVLSTSMSEPDWLSTIDAAGIVIECHRRALVVARDAAEAGRLLDENGIAQLQDLIVESQQTYTVTTESGTQQEVALPRRQYKPASNFLLRTDRQLVPFAPARDVADEMARLTAELASPAFAQLHPVVQSAYSHVALIRIHPFADGNGRLARTLACMPLLREAGLPQLILADQWPAYVHALLQSDEGNPQAIVQLFLAAQINSMDLARTLIDTAGSRPPAHPASPRPVAGTAEQLLLDLVAVHLREAIGPPGPDRQVSVTRSLNDRAALRLVTTGADGGPSNDVGFTVEPDDANDANDASGWLRLMSSAGDVLEVSTDDVCPVPLEVVHLRVRSWLDGLLARGVHGLADSARVRGLFVLGSPRSGTTLIGNWIGSHPEVLGLAEYGGFYIANSVAPAYLTRLPGAQHDGFLRELRGLAADRASRAARRQGCSWFCDATPWNLEIAGAIGQALPDAIFVLMLRHFSGAVLSLRQFPWAGDSWAEAAQLWVDLNRKVDQLPEDRTIVVGYDILAGDPTATLDGIREALLSLGLDPDRFDDNQFAHSHAHVIGDPRPTVASRVDGSVRFHPIPSLDGQRWTPEAHAAVWPVVADAHRALVSRFAGAYESPPRPEHVSVHEW